MKLFEHRSYERYYDRQCWRAKRKLKTCWVRREEIETLSAYILKHNPDVSFGICHGVRNGVEVRFFRHFLNIPVVGTELSPLGKYFKYVIEMDFHDVMPNWRNNVDFIYSNSLDHSNDPKYCLDRWMSCLNSQGLCIVQWSKNSAPGDNKLTETDCFLATKEEYESFFSEKYHIKDILSFETTQTRKKGQMFWFVITKKPV